MKNKISVPGKVIIAGEHSVVYGEPALVGAIDKRLWVESELTEDKEMVIKDDYKDLKLAEYAVGLCLREVGNKFGGVRLEIKSDLPKTGGLGSSAALATGIVYSLLKNKSDVEKAKLIKMVEDQQHGNSSGVDQTIVREGGILKYQKGKGFEKIKDLRLPEFLIIDSGKCKESTGEMVRRAAGKIKGHLKKMGRLVNEWEPGKIRENERILEEIGVVGEKAKAMVRKIEAIGGSAKICGGGGVKEGSGILLAVCEKMEKLVKLAESKNWPWWQVKIGAEGVRYEKS